MAQTVSDKKAARHEAKAHLHHSIAEAFNGTLRDKLLNEEVFESLGHPKRALSLWPHYLKTRGPTAESAGLRPLRAARSRNV